MSVSPQVSALKAEGNNFFAAKDWSNAHAKYTEAIAAPGGGSVAELYCNRAACSMHMEQYRDAVADAKQATRLNDGYVKAWGRLGSAYVALRQHMDGIQAYERGVALILALPHPSPADTKLKDEYRAIAKLERKKRENVSDQRASGNSPWEIAEEMKPALQVHGRDGSQSCVWAIADAHKEFQQGLDIMDKMVVSSTGKGTTIQATRGAIHHLSDALLRDERCFHVGGDFRTRFNRQLKSEAHTVNAWIDSKDAQLVVSKAKSRISEKGWDDVRPALAITLRGWILQAYLHSLDSDFTTSIAILAEAVKLIELGGREWAFVPKRDRGSVFEAEFDIGVRLLHTVIQYRHCTSSGKPMPPADRVSQLNATACNLMDRASSPIPGIAAREAHKDDKGFLVSFFTYPLAEAYAVRGFCDNYQGLQIAWKDQKAGESYFIEAYTHYMAAAEHLPLDDERRILYRKHAAEILLRLRAPLSYLVPVVDSLRTEYPKIKPLWAISALARSGRDEGIEKLIERGIGWRRDLATGRRSMEYVPPLA